jgi:predicted ArsR family transcriptional regulator
MPPWLARRDDFRQWILAIIEGVVERTWQVMAALVDPVRRSLYEYVRREGRPVTREDAAQAVDISRTLAAFHLDKLVEIGVLRAHYEAPPEQPRGRGRTPKVYEATSEALSLTLPPRQYELVATILADAIDAEPTDAYAAAHRQAAALGQAIGLGTARRSGRAVERASNALFDLGYEPRREADGIVLRNCPFHALAARHTALVCGINLEFVTGLLAGIDGDPLRAELQPRPDGCCVAVRPR